MKGIRSLLRWTRPAMDVVLPPHCWATGEDAASGIGLSENTRIEIARLAAQPHCLHCGLTVGPYELHDARDPCAQCGQREVGVMRIARVGTFTEPLITLVHRLKFGRSWELATVLAPFLYQALLRVTQATDVPVDALVPVPLHWSRRMRRGFNQAEELAREVRALSGWPVINALLRQRRTLEQARLEAPSVRARNLRGAFACRHAARRGRLAGKHVWLLDDVSTTGATLHAATMALRRLPLDQRPASINAVVVCVTDHYSPPPPGLPETV